MTGHRRAIIAGLAALVLALAGLGVGWLVLSDERRRASGGAAEARASAGAETRPGPFVAHAPSVIRGPIGDPGRPVVLYIHGGGWVYTGATLTNDPVVERWARADVAVWSTDYRPGFLSLPDVEAAYRDVRRAVGPGRRVCAHGASAGAQLALILASRAPGLACVVSDSGVVDLRRVPGDTELAEVVRTILVPHGGYRRWDPLTNAARIPQPVLLVAHRDDPLVPPAQSRRMARALQRAAYVELPAGRGPRSYHGPRTTVRADRAAWAAMRRLVVDGRLPGR